MVNKPFFHMQVRPSDHAVEVAVADLKALFFVRDFEGTPSRREKQTFSEDKVYQGRKARVTFRDGEHMVGTVLSYDRTRPGFFILPVDEEEGNNMRVFIPSPAAVKVEFL